MIVDALIVGGIHNNNQIRNAVSAHQADNAVAACFGCAGVESLCQNIIIFGIVNCADEVVAGGDTALRRHICFRKDAVVGGGQLQIFDIF